MAEAKETFEVVWEALPPGAFPCVEVTVAIGDLVATASRPSLHIGLRDALAALAKPLAEKLGAGR